MAEKGSQLPIVDQVKAIYSQGEYKPGIAHTVGRFYQPLPFPDFRAVPYGRNTLDRWEKIQDNLNLGKVRTAVDLGCANGFFSFMLGKQGATVTGVDYFKPYVEAGNRVAEHYGMPLVNFVHGEVEDFMQSTPDNWDLLLLMNVDKWMTKAYGKEESQRRVRSYADRANTTILEISTLDHHWGSTDVPSSFPKHTSEMIYQVPFYELTAEVGPVLLPEEMAPSTKQIWMLTRKEPV